MFAGQDILGIFLFRVFNLGLGVVGMRDLGMGLILHGELVATSHGVFPQICEVL